MVSSNCWPSSKHVFPATQDMIRISPRILTGGPRHVCTKILAGGHVPACPHACSPSRPRACSPSRPHARSLSRPPSTPHHRPPSTPCLRPLSMPHRHPPSSASHLLPLALLIVSD